ncbi:hypothetical protein BHE74_00026382 [Ensete ventricosum]|nr:hypothetical protein BHE74_00026382 [Ensete ventricosum]
MISSGCCCVSSYHSLGLTFSPIRRRESLPNASAREQKNWLAYEMENIYQPRPPLAASLFEATGGEGAGVMLSRDPKPRLRWTPDLHDRFVDAVTKLGGPDSECAYMYSFLRFHVPLIPRIKAAMESH